MPATAPQENSPGFRSNSRSSARPIWAPSSAASCTLFPNSASHPNLHHDMGPSSGRRVRLTGETATTPIVRRRLGHVQQEQPQTLDEGYTAQH